MLVSILKGLGQRVNRWIAGAERVGERIESALESIDDDGTVRLVVCETVSAVVLHLREDDGQRFEGGGLDVRKTLCARERDENWNGVGWDTHIPAPVDPQAAFAVRQRPRFCEACVRQWALDLGYEQEEIDQMLAEAVVEA